MTSFSTGAFEGGPTFGPHISLGVVTGATLTPDFRNVTYGQTFAFSASFSSSPGAFLLGPMLEVTVARGFFFEGDAIHQPMRSIFHGGFDGIHSSYTRSINTWSFPLLGKYKLLVHGMKPFVEAGPTFRVAAMELNGASPYGVAAGGGIETHLWRLAIAPSVRYTHWGRNSPSLAGAYSAFRNQVAVLAGFSF